ncbi:MAG: endolytic transglycosylase MltG [Candidatus Paceibacterota bacterium]|jgi:UPF0755 protein
MGQKEDFKNFFIIKKIEEDDNEKTLLEAILKNKMRIFLFIIIIFFGIFLYKNLFSKVDVTHLKDPNGFFQVENGDSINYVASELKDQQIIKSSLVFKIYMKLSFGKNVAQAGIYKISPNDTLVSIANKIKRADYAVPPTKVTIPEGSTNQEVAEIISNAFVSNQNAFLEKDDFSVSNIMNSLQNLQGYIYPETYLFLPNISLSEVVSSLKNKSYDSLKELFTELKNKTDKNDESLDPKDLKIKLYSSDLKSIDLTSYFDDKNKSININKKLTIVNDIGTTTLSIHNILIMASYLEGEANNDKDMKIVSGVLWTRLKIGYFLQIDAATSTYKNKGFTKSPINNPGMMAIKAALNPIKTGYLYYITGKDGEMYYSTDYEGHLLNIKKHLR